MASSRWQQPWVADWSKDWPSEAVEYLRQWVLSSRSPAFLVTDLAARLVSSGGDLAHFGLGSLGLGKSVPQEAYFLEGLLPIGESTCLLRRVETTAGVFADIHLFRIAAGDCVLLLDASVEVAERAEIEQALRRTEEQLRQSEKMEALGRLVGGVAHDFNNLLTVILGYSHVLAGAPIESKYVAAATEIKDAADKAAQMTRHLLSFSRRHAHQPEVLDLNAVIFRLQPLLRRLIREDIILNIKVDPALAFVEADAGQIDQVLMNLVTNARDAMMDGGTIEIATANVEVDGEYLNTHPHTHLDIGPHAQISVRDNGSGMDAETVARAFEPFFTSKEPGQGTGLGLAIVYGIVYQSGGDIVLTSRPGAGTCVEILLPAVEKPLAPNEVVAEDGLARGDETILLVEDEYSVRQLVREFLMALGYKVLESAEPEAALALCERHRNRIDLLMTDFVMPQMNGSELAGRIAAIHPETRVLYMSGYAQESPSRRGPSLKDSVFLSKPFTPALLAERVREALGRPHNG